MSLIRPLACLAALLAVLGMAPAVRAQKHQPFIDNIKRGPTASAYTFPGYFEPDFQFFAPAEVDNFGGPEPANVGWYFTMDKVYWNISRPNVGPRDGQAPGASSVFLVDNNVNDFGVNPGSSPWDGDFTWGNRFEIGYMTDERTGWNVVLHHLSGPNEYVENQQERINRFNEDDTDPTDPQFPISDRNPRYYILKDSVNVASFSSAEFNKVWRRKEFHNGTVLEPMVGVRIMNFKNFVRDDNYQRYDIDPQSVDVVANPNPPPPDLLVPPVPTVDGPVELLNSHYYTTSNNLLGGQIGARLFHQRSHWMLSGEVKFFGCANFQYFEQREDTTITVYDDTASLGGAVTYENFQRQVGYDQRTQFTWGGEVRAEAAYELTREISFRFGMSFIDLGTGIGRGESLQEKFARQDVQMAGLTMGVTVNR
ncbi:MAG: hypothetical protein SFU86_06085 [Pirellulaceae bacterium]|nr:hypothetical protein [Pirellulaceae bacterium]